MPDGIQRALLFALPAVLFLGLFGRSLDYAFVWTDEGEIEAGGLMLEDRPIWSAIWQPMYATGGEVDPETVQPYYRPLQVIAVNALDRAFGRLPRHFRALSLALGAATSCLFTWLAWVLCRNRTAALLSGAIAAVHPVLIEVHVWIAGLSNALVGAFAVASWLLAALAFRDESRSRAHAFAVASLAALVPALLSKENALAIPLGTFALALAHAGAPRAPHRGAHLLAAARWLLPAQVVVAGLYAGVWRPWVLGGALAAAQPLGGSYAVHLATMIASWPDRIGWLLLPLTSTSSDVVALMGPGDVRVFIGVAVLALSIYFAWRLWRAGQPLAALVIAWVWIGFAPSAGVVPLIYARAERYLYLSLFGLALLPAALAGLPAWSRSVPRWIGVGLGVLAVLGLAERSHERIPDWRSDETLFARDFGRDPRFREGAFMLARAQAFSGELERARETLDALIARLPELEGFSGYLREGDFAELHCYVNLQLGRPKDSLPMLGWIEPGSPDPGVWRRLYYCAALTFEAVGKLHRAAGIHERLVGLDPAHPDPRYALGLARSHLALGELRAATKWLRTAIPRARRDPDLAREAQRIALQLADAQKQRQLPGPAPRTE